MASKAKRVVEWTEHGDEGRRVFAKAEDRDRFVAELVERGVESDAIEVK